MIGSRSPIIRIGRVVARIGLLVVGRVVTIGPVVAVVDGFALFLLDISRRRSSEAAETARSLLLETERNQWIAIGEQRERRRIVDWLRSASNGSETFKYARLFAGEIEAKEHMK